MIITLLIITWTVRILFGMFLLWRINHITTNITDRFEESKLLEKQRNQFHTVLGVLRACILLYTSFIIIVVFGG